MDLNGILPLYKPAGMTSHDCVAKIRKILKMKKVGHTGTLDPEVTGVLPICIGRATKVAQYMSDYSKTYEGEVTLGFSTTTEDFTGEVVKTKKVEVRISMEELEKVIAKFTGEIEQIPPMYSAVKVNGKKLYEYARAGQQVERPRRKIEVYHLTILGEPIYANDMFSFSFRVNCSKGTYVRTLAVDIGQALGYPAHMSALTRTASGPFVKEDCLTFEKIEQLVAEGNISSFLLKIETALAHFKRITVPKDIEKKILNGSVLPLPINIQEDRFTIFNEFDDCLAVYIKHPTKPGLMKPEKIIKID